MTDYFAMANKKNQSTASDEALLRRKINPRENDFSGVIGGDAIYVEGYPISNAEKSAFKRNIISDKWLENTPKYDSNEKYNPLEDITEEYSILLTNEILKNARNQYDK